MEDSDFVGTPSEKVGLEFSSTKEAEEGEQRGIILWGLLTSDSLLVSEIFENLLILLLYWERWKKIDWDEIGRRRVAIRG